jgi:hypothetical protein
MNTQQLLRLGPNRAGWLCILWFSWMSYHTGNPRYIIGFVGVCGLCLGAAYLFRYVDSAIMAHRRETDRGRGNRGPWRGIDQ